MKLRKGNKIEEVKIDRYQETKRRLAWVNKRFNICSDKELIEYMAEEIEQYRNRINEQHRIIDELSKKTIQSEEVTLNVTDDELVDEDIIEIISTTQYADGKPIISKMKYKYKEN